MMEPIRRRLISLAFLACLAAGVALGYPPATLTIPSSTLIFSHAKHVSEGGIECSVCHAAADSSRLSQDKLYPTMDVCGECHDVSNDKECGLCHRNPNEPTASPNPERAVIFSHQAHIKKKTACTRCHDGVGGSTGPDPSHMPTMSLCLDCHDGTTAGNQCALCHGRQLSLADIHPPGWRHAHGDRAALDRDWCAGCHRQERFCLDCHRGDNNLGSIHDLNYAFTHGLDANSKEADCARCHDRKTFCVGCHESENRIPLLHSSAGWLANHGRAARNDVESCASCHEADSPTCARAGCHRDADGIRGTDPPIHPAGLNQFESHGPWHTDDGYFCYQCHTRTGQAGVGFCGYCHD